MTNKAQQIPRHSKMETTSDMGIEIDKGVLLNTATGMISKFNQLDLEQVNFNGINLHKEALIDKAREVLREACVKNNEFQFTDKDEKLLLKSLEDNNFNHFYVRSAGLNQELKTITDKITGVMLDLYGKKLVINVVITDNPLMQNNAWALPNGTVLIDLTLLKTIEYVDELYFILAHECAHILKQHTIVYNNIDSISKKFLGNILSRIRLKNTLFKIIAESSVTIALNHLKKQKVYKFLRYSDEYEADKIAAKVLCTLDLLPVTGCAFLKKIDPENQISDTHPRTSDRISRISETSKNNPVNSRSLASPETISSKFKQNVNGAIRQVQQKRKFIKTVSWTASTGAALFAIVLIYLMGSISPGSEGGIINEIRSSSIGLILRLLFQAAYIFIPVIFYLVHEKTYQLLK